MEIVKEVPATERIKKGELPAKTCVALSGSVTFGSYVTTVDMPVVQLDDPTPEPDETVEASLIAGAEYTVGSGNATVAIADNDLPRVSVYGLTDAVEGATGGAGMFRLVREGNLSQPLTVSFAPPTGTALSVVDYALLPTSVTFGANQDAVEVSVFPANDGLPEPTEVVTLSLLTSSAYTPGTPNTANINVFNAPPPAGVGGSGSGTGLFARYYNTKELYDLKTTRIDAQVRTAAHDQVRGRQLQNGHDHARHQFDQGRAVDGGRGAIPSERFNPKKDTGAPLQPIKP